MKYPKWASPEAITDLLLTLQNFIEAQENKDGELMKEVIDVTDRLLEKVNEDL